MSRRSLHAKVGTPRRDCRARRSRQQQLLQEESVRQCVRLLSNWRRRRRRQFCLHSRPSSPARVSVALSPTRRHDNPSNASRRVSSVCGAAHLLNALAAVLALRAQPCKHADSNQSPLAVDDASLTSLQNRCGAGSVRFVEALATFQKRPEALSVGAQGATPPTRFRAVEIRVRCRNASSVVNAWGTVLGSDASRTLCRPGSVRLAEAPRGLLVTSPEHPHPRRAVPHARRVTNRTIEPVRWAWMGPTSAPRLSVDGNRCPIPRTGTAPRMFPTAAAAAKAKKWRPVPPLDPAGCCWCCRALPPPSPARPVCC
jgi:hypothetical protein